MIVSARQAWTMDPWGVRTTRKKSSLLQSREQQAKALLPQCRLFCRTSSRAPCMSESPFRWIPVVLALVVADQWLDTLCNKEVSPILVLGQLWHRQLRTTFESTKQNGQNASQPRDGRDLIPAFLVRGCRPSCAAHVHGASSRPPLGLRCTMTILLDTGICTT